MSYVAMGDVCDPTDPAYDPTACASAGGTPGVAGGSSGSSGSGSPGPVTGSTSSGGVSSDGSSSSPSTFSSTTSTWTSSGGVCYANSNSPTTLSAFKELQRQLNRLAYYIKAPAIAVDGQIGPLTMGLIGTINGAVTGSLSKVSTLVAALGLSSTSCDITAAAAVSGSTDGVQALADALGVPSSVSSPSGSPQVWNTATGAPQSQPMLASVGDVWSNLSSTQQMMLVAGGAVLALSAMKKKPTSAVRTSGKAMTVRRTSRR